MKFFRFADFRLRRTGCGVLGYVTNHRYIGNPTFRGMRQSLVKTFEHVSIVDLHGSKKPKEMSPDGSEDENVFDIQQGVSVGCFVLPPEHRTTPRLAMHADLFGLRDGGALHPSPDTRITGNKYGWLRRCSLRNITWMPASPQSPDYYLFPLDYLAKSEYDKLVSVEKLLPTRSVGLYSARDKFAIQWSMADIADSIRRFISLDPETARSELELGDDSDDWTVVRAQEDVRNTAANKALIRRVSYRPFDIRYTYYTARANGFLCRPRSDVMLNLLSESNIALCYTRRSREGNTSNFFVARHLVDKCILSSADNAHVAPLYTSSRNPGDEQRQLGQDAFETKRKINICREHTKAISDGLQLHFVRQPLSDLCKTFGSLDLLHYVYSVLNSPAYRNRYAEFLKIDFPRVPLISNVELFRSLCRLGADLVALHLLENHYDAASWNQPDTTTTCPLDRPITEFVGNDRLVTKVGEKGKKLASVRDSKGRLYINATSYFDGLPVDVWEFHIGGYQVCHKWLYDRMKAGRSLSDEDIAHYHRIVVALNETIRLMQEIDEVIDAHGGWPDAFAPAPKNGK